MYKNRMTKEDALFDLLWMYDDTWRIEQERDSVTLINDTSTRIYGETLEAALLTALYIYGHEAET